MYFIPTQKFFYFCDNKAILCNYHYLKAIEESDTVAKAWFRRGEAQLALNDCESARADFDKCLQLEPDNKVRQDRGERTELL